MCPLLGELFAILKAADTLEKLLLVYAPLSLLACPILLFTGAEFYHTGFDVPFGWTCLTLSLFSGVLCVLFCFRRGSKLDTAMLLFSSASMAAMGWLVLCRSKEIANVDTTHDDRLGMIVPIVVVAALNAANIGTVSAAFASRLYVLRRKRVANCEPEVGMKVDL
ncbi:hypothetical protein AAVH_30319 [Aphelenchoides avenae]|nr:hypothetical protein AAVH_30319 [Aphelenchus avenae]